MILKNLLRNWKCNFPNPQPPKGDLEFYLTESKIVFDEYLPLSKNF